MKSIEEKYRMSNVEYFSARLTAPALLPNYFSESVQCTSTEIADGATYSNRLPTDQIPDQLKYEDNEVSADRLCLINQKSLAFKRFGSK
jgi:hypothetical protein